MDVGLIYRKAFLVLDEYRSKYLGPGRKFGPKMVRDFSTENLKCEEKIENENLKLGLKGKAHR